jgi:hypothetical protein
MSVSKATEGCGEIFRRPNAIDANRVQGNDGNRPVCRETTISRPGVDSGPECALHVELKDVLSGQQTFRLAQADDLRHLACRTAGLSCRM